jgi:hypothetical protein
VVRIIVVVLVTDYERKFVLGVATSQDLEVNLCLVHSRNYSPLTRSCFNTGIRLATRHLVSALRDLDCHATCHIYSMSYLYIDNTTAVLYRTFPCNERV